MSVRLGRSIQILRSAKSLSMTEVAEKANLSKPYLSLVESGDREPSLETLQKIANALDIPSESLVMMGMAPDVEMKATGAVTKQIVQSVEQLMRMEQKLKALLEQ